jgi:hypothetical protein
MDPQAMSYITPVVMGIAILELIASGTWSTFYFTTGIPLFRRSARLAVRPDLTDTKLEALMAGSPWSPLRFRSISDTEVAFREQLLAWTILTYTPLVHGLIRYDETSQTLHVVGYSNWTIPIVVLAVAVVPASIHTGAMGARLLFPVFAAGIVVLLYLIQLTRYGNVLKAIESRSKRVAARDHQPQ